MLKSVKKITLIFLTVGAAYYSSLYPSCLAIHIVDSEMITIHLPVKGLVYHLCQFQLAVKRSSTVLNKIIIKNKNLENDIMASTRNNILGCLL